MDGGGSLFGNIDVLKRRVTVCLQTAVTQTEQWMKSEIVEAAVSGSGSRALAAKAWGTDWCGWGDAATARAAGSCCC